MLSKFSTPSKLNKSPKYRSSTILMSKQIFWQTKNLDKTFNKIYYLSVIPQSSTTNEISSCSKKLKSKNNCKKMIHSKSEIYKKSPKPLDPSDDLDELINSNNSHNSGKDSEYNFSNLHSDTLKYRQNPDCHELKYKYSTVQVLKVLSFYKEICSQSIDTDGNQNQQIEPMKDADETWTLNDTLNSTIQSIDLEPENSTTSKKANKEYKKLITIEEKFNILQFYSYYIDLPRKIILRFEPIYSNLYSLLADSDQWPDINLLKICQQMLTSVGFIHENHLVHLQLNLCSFYVVLAPDNNKKIKFPSRGKDKFIVKLSNFELSLRTNFLSRSFNFNNITELTPLEYIAPEYLLGQKILSRSIDHWGLGCCFLQIAELLKFRIKPKNFEKCNKNMVVNKKTKNSAKIYENESIKNTFTSTSSIFKTESRIWDLPILGSSLFKSASTRIRRMSERSASSTSTGEKSREINPNPNSAIEQNAAPTGPHLPPDLPAYIVPNILKPATSHIDQLVKIFKDFGTPKFESLRYSDVFNVEQNYQKFPKYDCSIEFVYIFCCADLFKKFLAEITYQKSGIPKKNNNKKNVTDGMKLDHLVYFLISSLLQINPRRRTKVTG